jgi:hypothetical protein
LIALRLLTTYQRQESLNQRCGPEHPAKRDICTKLGKAPSDTQCRLLDVLVSQAEMRQVFGEAN